MFVSCIADLQSQSLLLLENRVVVAAHDLAAKLSAAHLPKKAGHHLRCKLICRPTCTPVFHIFCANQTELLSIQKFLQ